MFSPENLNQIITTIAIWGVPVLLAITLHEAAHGYVAKLWGDKTALMLGRITLNPFKHVDPFGTVVMPVILAIAGAPILGYAKPVPVTFRNLKPLKQGIIVVALAGPGANLFLAICSIVLLYIVPFLPSFMIEPLVLMLIASVQINLLLMCFNLLPILPLDGGRVLHTLLPPKLAYQYGTTERYGMIIILLLLFLGVFGKILSPMMQFMFNIIAWMLPQWMLQLGM
jgi:Zn-dependent protease